MKENLRAVLNVVFSHEGGYADHPKDPGGSTNMGITHTALADWRGHKVTKEDVKHLTKEEAAAIYSANYWNVLNCDKLHSGVDLVVMDFGVNSGTKRAALSFQKCVGVKQDGHIGPKTLEAALVVDPLTLVQRICASRMAFLRSLNTWDVFKKGWSKRVSDVETEASEMIKTATTTRKNVVEQLPSPTFPTELGWLLNKLFTALTKWRPWK